MLAKFDLLLFVIPLLCFLCNFAVRIINQEAIYYKIPKELYWIVATTLNVRNMCCCSNLAHIFPKSRSLLSSEHVAYMKKPLICLQTYILHCMNIEVFFPIIKVIKYNNTPKTKCLVLNKTT